MLSVTVTCGLLKSATRAMDQSRATCLSLTLRRLNGLVKFLILTSGLPSRPSAFRRGVPARAAHSPADQRIRHESGRPQVTLGKQEASSPARGGYR